MIFVNFGVDKIEFGGINMEHNIVSNIAKRLKGLRDAIGLNTKEMSEYAGVEESVYITYETGSEDIPLSVMHQICQKCGVDISDVLTGESPHNALYALTHADKGTCIEDNEEYTYEALAHGFKGKKADPYIITIKRGSTPSSPNNKYDSQKFYYVIEGKVELTLGSKKIMLVDGDSIYFNSSIYHSLRVVEGEEARILILIM